jgi:hypothetical protein
MNNKYVITVQRLDNDGHITTASFHPTSSPDSVEIATYHDSRSLTIYDAYASINISKEFIIDLAKLLHTN